MQQINLLNGDLLPQKEGWGTKHFLYAWLGFAGLLIAYTSWQGLSVWGLKSELSETQSNIEEMRQANAAARHQGIEPKDMREQIALLQSQQREQDQLVELLRAQQKSSGFSAYLTGLADARIEGVWLSEIEIAHAGGRRISLRGAATSASYIPKFLHNLAKESQFDGQRFEQLELHSSDDDDFIHFSMVSPDGDVSG